MSNRRRSLVLSGLLLVATPSYAQEGAREIGLGELAYWAVRNPPAITLARMRVSAASARYEVSRGAYWPTLSLQSELAALDQQQQFALPDRPNEQTKSLITRGTLDGRAEWLLANFGGRTGDVARTRRDLESAEHGAAAARMASLRTACELYIVVLTTQHLRANASVSLERREALSRLIGRLVDAGMRPRVDLQRARIEELAARSELAVLDARASAQTSSLAIALGMEPDTSLNLAELDSALLESSFSEREAESSSLAQRPELAQQQSLVESRRAAARVARSRRLPALSLFGAANLQKYLLMSGDGVDGNGYMFTGGAVARWSVMDVSAYRALDAAHADVDVEQAALQERALNVRQKAVFGVRDLARARAALEQALQILEAAGVTREMQNRRYQGGEASLLELLDAEGVEQEARSRKIQVEAELETARIALLDATGMLERRLVR